MKRLILATSNPGKAREIRQILRDAYDEIVTADELGIDVSDIEEDADTFQGNAEKKAIAVSRRVEGDVLADDSGLEVKALRGAPGVRSARFAGEAADDSANNTKLIGLMEGEGDRSACFVCCMVIANDGKVLHAVEERVSGEIIAQPRGSDGFGYDSLFFFPEEDMTFAEMDPEKKNSISHRGKALKTLQQTLSKQTYNMACSSVPD